MNTEIHTAKIGIIGAGPAGLAALKTLLETPQYQAGKWVPIVFEARDDVGGVWLPSGIPSKSEGLPPTPLYDSLTTNLPHPVMSFSSFAFPPSTPLFPRAASVETYLRDFVSHFELLPHIRLRTRVQSVGWDGGKKKWVVGVSTSSDNGSHSDQHEFDLVLVCNGHHNIPRYPTILGLRPWLDAGLASHSMFYRNPAASIPLADLPTATILVVGGGPSGTDVTSDLLDVARKVIFSSSGNVSEPPNPSPKEVSRKEAINKPRADKFNLPTKTVTFTDETEETIDYCILATGYEVDFPFFDQSLSTFFSPSNDEADLPKFKLPKSLSSPIDIASKCLSNSTWGVAPLARHLFPFPGFLPSSHPFSLASFLGLSSTSAAPPPTSLAFLGLLVRVAPLPLLERQARAALAAFASPSSFSQKIWDAEERALLQRKDALRAKFNEGGGVPADTKKQEEYISKQWLHFEEQEQFEYRDSLDELARMLSESQIAPGSAEPQQHKTKPWEREMYAHKAPLRAAWRTLEARGEAERWVEGVGRGESTGEDGKRRTAEEEWVDLMRRVLDWWEREQLQARDNMWKR